MPCFFHKIMLEFRLRKYEKNQFFSIFSERRVVWAKDFPALKSASPKGFTASDRDKLIEYVKNPNEGTLLILSAEMLEEKSELVKELKKLKCFENMLNEANIK